MACERTVVTAADLADLFAIVGPLALGSLNIGIQVTGQWTLRVPERRDGPELGQEARFRDEAQGRDGLHVDVNYASLRS